LAVFSFVNKVRDSISEIENGLVDGIAAIGPWITPLPSAVLVANAVVKDLHWIPALGWITAVIIESLGLTTVSTSLLLWDYNVGKRKTDPGAPFLLAASLVGVYLFSAIGLTVFLDIFPELGRYAPALFPLLALVGAVNLALRSGHRRRLSGIAQDRAERKAERQSSHLPFTQPSNLLMSNLTSSIVKTDTSLDKAQAARKANLTTRMDNLLTLYLDNPLMGATAAARTLNISRQTIYTYLEQLEATGRIHRNGKGIEVILK
jgi:hypothetical protein